MAPTILSPVYLDTVSHKIHTLSVNGGGVMASLVNKPLTSLCTANNSDSRSPALFAAERCRLGSRKLGNSVRISSGSASSRKGGGGGASGIVCKAVSLEAETEIEGLNIAEDVTQVSLLFF